MSPVAVIALLVIVPIVVILLVAGIVLGPQVGRAGRWRPGDSWSDPDEWFGPDARQTEADQQASALETLAKPGELRPVDSAAESAATAPGVLGGARGRW